MEAKAIHLFKVGKYPEAEKLEAIVVRGREEIMGPTERSTLKAKHNYA